MHKCLLYCYGKDNGRTEEAGIVVSMSSSPIACEATGTAATCRRPGEQGVPQRGSRFQPVKGTSPFGRGGTL